MNTHHLSPTSLAVVSVSAACSLLSPAAEAAGLYENFDGGGNTPYAFTVTSGATAPAVLSGGASGNYARITFLEGSDNRSIAFNENPAITGPAPFGLRLSFNFRLTDDAANAAAGGCCGSAADGLGIGLFATSAYGSTGGVNPTGADWERPRFAGAFTVGLDVFQNIDDVSLNWNGAEVANASLHNSVDLNNALWHRVALEVFPDGANAIANLTLVEDVFGNTRIHQVFSDQPIAGLDLANLPGYRLIAGGRTGGAYAAGDLDNISVVIVPEPSTTVLLSLGAGLLLFRRRTNR